MAGDKVDEVFIGSCMTNIGHFRAAGKLLEQNKDPLSTRLWMSPPTKMDQAQLMEEGYYNIYGRAGVRTEMPGCSLCMGNQARVAAGSTVLSTSTRNFPNRLGDGANVYLPPQSWRRWVPLLAVFQRRRNTCNMPVRLTPCPQMFIAI